MTVKGQWRATGAPAGELKTFRTLSYSGPEEQYCWIDEREDPRPGKPAILTQACDGAELTATDRWERSLKTSFAQSASPGSDDAALASDVLAIAREELDKAQQSLRAELLSKLSRKDDGSFTPAGLALERLTGAKVVVQSFLNLAFPIALAREERFRGLLYGDDAILDRGLVEDEIRVNVKVDEANTVVRDLTDRDQDPIARIKEQERERLERLRNTISGWQQQIADGKHAEYHPLIRETLAELELARLVVYSGPECRDRKDNDGDGKVDHPDDPQCGSSADNLEAPDPAPPGNTVLPAATGTPRDGQILTASNGTWSGSPTSFGYSWQRCDGAGAACVPIAGATARTYRASPADVGRRLRTVVTARNTFGAATATSAPTGIVAAAPPGNTALPAATGVARDGRVLTASNGTWSGNPTSFAYSWRRCDRAGAACVPIAGATARTYRASPADVGRRLRAVVTARSAVGAASATSAPTGIVAAAPPGNTAPPKIAGTAKRGVLLTASRGAWSGTAPLGFGYRWLRCNAQGVRCVAIPKATARTYRSAAGDVGRRLRIIVTARNAAGAAGARSAPTRAVAR